MAAVRNDQFNQDKLPLMGDVIERIGFGWAQIRTGMLGGSVWLADGAELLLIGTVTRAVSKEWNMRAWQRGSVVSVVFVGILFGNSICGPIGDRFGRRLPILVSYLGISIFSVMSAMSQDFYQLAIIRLFVGASFGIGQPAINALTSEVTPNYWRILMNSFVQGLFILGELFSACLIWWDDPNMRNLDWRWLLLMGAIPSVVCGVLSCLFLQQSPQYLAVRGEHDAAKLVLESMARSNCVTDISVDFKKIPPKPPSSALETTIAPLKIIFSRRLAYSTCAVVYSCFTLNVIFYGCLYAFPQVVADVKMASSAAVSLIMGALWEVPGSLLAIACGMFWPRRPCMAAYLISTAISLVSFGYAISHTYRPGQSGHRWNEAFLHFGYMGIKAFAIVGFVSVYQYSTEIYPTVARTTGTAACVAGGRLGGMIAPMAFEWLFEMTQNVSFFFYFVAALCAVNLVIVAFLPFETFGKSLDDHHAEEVTPITAAG